MLLLGVPALPVPTGGATHAFEVIAVLLALQLVAGRDEIWLPKRWRAKPLVIGGSVAAFIAPPFTGLDTLPALGVVLPRSPSCSKNTLLAVVALVVGAAGILLSVFVGAAAIDGLQKLV